MLVSREGILYEEERHHEMIALHVLQIQSSALLFTYISSVAVCFPHVSVYHRNHMRQSGML